jgi:tRNA(Ile)-lysidine synthase TilS/MesJ
MAAGNKHLGYKAALNDIEAASPGTKHAFYFGFLADARDRFAGTAQEDAALGACGRCGAPTSEEVCAFCRLVERTAGAEPVVFSPRSGRRPGR